MSTALVSEEPATALSPQTRRMTLLIPLMLPSSGSTSETNSVTNSSSSTRRGPMLLLILTVPSSLANSTSFGDAVDDDDAFNELLNRLMQSFQPRGPPPASKNFVESLPKVSITSELQIEAHRCPVCLIDYEVDEEVLKLPCSHLFHQECITTWLKQANTCCVCRHELPKQEEEAKPDEPSAQQEETNDLSGSNPDLPPLIDDEDSHIVEDLIESITQEDEEIPELVEEFERIELSDMTPTTPVISTPASSILSATLPPTNAAPSPIPQRRVLDDDLPPRRESQNRISRWFQSRFSCFRS